MQHINKFYCCPSCRLKALIEQSPQSPAANPESLVREKANIIDLKWSATIYKDFIFNLMKV